MEEEGESEREEEGEEEKKPEETGIVIGYMMAI